MCDESLRKLVSHIFILFVSIYHNKLLLIGIDKAWSAENTLLVHCCPVNGPKVCMISSVTNIQPSFC